jgi:2-dehydro-3-deoxygluconokinase
MQRFVASRKTQVGVIGECLIELTGAEFGTLHQSFGGDTLNTALYLTRLARQSAAIKYITGLGADSLSDIMQSRWQDEGIDTELTLRDAARLPGLYQIQVDHRGERRFLYWRQNSAARYLLQHPDFDRVRQALSHLDLIYLSGISLAILPPQDRATLIDMLVTLAGRGIAVAFDTNYRESLWPSADDTRACITAMLPATRLLFATFDDEQRLWGDAAPEATLARYRAAKVPSTIIKLGADGCLYGGPTEALRVPAPPIATVVDTTAAGDSFNGASLAAWLAGANHHDCCRAGNALAGVVIQHRGAIIPAPLTPSLNSLLGGP